MPAFESDRLGRSSGRHLTPVHLDLAVADLDAAVERVLGAGGTVAAGPRTVDGDRLATCVDPWGHGFCLIGEQRT